MRAWLIAAVLLAAPVEHANAQYFQFGKNKVHYGAHDWYFLRTDHFDVYFYEGGAELADYAASAAESAYRQVADLFEYEAGQSIPLLVYPSHNEFAVTNAVSLPTFSDGIGGVTELYKNRIAVPFTGDYRDFRRVIHHELVHAVINDIYFGGSLQSILSHNIQTRIPPWFNEGLAEFAAQGWDSESDMYIRAAVLEDYLPPVRYLSGYFAYRGGQSVWDFIAAQYGREKIAEILQRLRLGRSVEGAFRSAIGVGVDGLSDRWKKALREVYFPEVAAREDISEVGRALVTRDQGLYNTSPALSPQGDRLAFVTTRSGLFDIYLASSTDGTILRRLVAGQTSSDFETLRILSPGLTWSPDGRQLAVAVKRGASDAIALIDVETLEIRHLPVPEVHQVLAVSWNPDGTTLALEATRGAQGDIYMLDLASRELTNLTDDVYSDHAPSWSPDGRSIVFHSDRGAAVDLRTDTADRAPMPDRSPDPYDLYRIVVGADQAERLTDSGPWDSRMARFGSDPNRLLFISDRNGVENLYEKSLVTGSERPLTDLAIGISQVSVSADGQRAAVVSLLDGTPSIFLVRTPFARSIQQRRLVPTVWARRVNPGDSLLAPALTLARGDRQMRNPFLRAALPPAPKPITGVVPRPEAQEGAAASGETSFVDFSQYAFSDAFFEAADTTASAPQSTVLSATARAERLESGAYRARRYKLNFSPDIVYGAAGYDVLYGVQGVTQMLFSDMLGDHRILAATNLLIDLRNSDYILSYAYLPRRVDWTVSGFHISRLLSDFSGFEPTYYRYRQYGGGLSASYPISKFRRVDASLSVIGVNQADITDALRPSSSRALLAPSITYTTDVTTPGILYPTAGHRFAVSLSGSLLSFDRKPIRFATLLGDFRGYTSFGRGEYVLAVRASGGASMGPQQQLFYTSGVLNWINRNFDDLNGFPISDAADFVFATPVLPLRGYEINARNGSYFGLVNAEFRFPLVAALLPGPLPLAPLYNVQGLAFIDAGTVWGGRGTDRRFNVFRTNPAGQRVFDDVLVGTGFGLRTIFLGYPVSFEFAWPFDGQRFGSRRTYLSLRLDF